jgi:outer membrane protein assembly factor BamA
MDFRQPLADTVKIPALKKQARTDSVSQYLHINKVLITGNKLTRPSIILRELRLKPGDVITETDLNYVLRKDQQKLFNLHLFNTVTIRPIPLDTMTIDLLVELEERWYTFPVPRFQLSDRNFNEWWENYNHDWSRVNYGIKLYQYNLWGRNHTLLLKAQFGFQKNFQLNYKIPYINKRQKQGLIFEMDYITGKSVPDSTIDHKLRYIKSSSILRTIKGVGITYTYRKNFYVEHRLKYEYKYSTIADTLQKLNENYLGNGSSRQEFDALTYELSSDHRDVSAYPLRGYYVLLGIQRSGIILHSDLVKNTAYFKFSSYIGLKNNFFLSTLSVLSWSGPDRLPYFNYTTMGYDKIFVRGYEVYVIEGPYFFLNKATLKKRIFSRNWHLNNWSVKQFNYLPLAIYIKTYADLGYVDNYMAYEKKGINNFLSDKLLSGAGFGVDIVTGYDMAIRLEYTFTSQNNGFFLHFKKEF